MKIDDNSNNSIIKTQINGEFNGWDGNTIFKMLNGQIWQQVSYPHSYLSHYAYNPKVTIRISSNSCIMKVEKVDKSINVVRLK